MVLGDGMPAEPYSSGLQKETERTSSQSLPERITDGLVRISAAADAGMKNVSNYVEFALPEAYDTKGLTDDGSIQDSDDDSFLLLDPTAHLYDDVQVRSTYSRPC